MRRCSEPMCRCHARRPRGFTLVELAVAVAMLATLFAAAAPSYAEWVAEARVAAFAQQLAYSLSLARSEAVKHGGRVNLCKVDAEHACTTAGGWEGGWKMYVDVDGNAKADASEPVVAVEPGVQSGITARGNQPVASYVSFNAFGQARLASGGLQIGTITVCKPGLKPWEVVLASTGRVRLERGTTRC